MSRKTIGGPNHSAINMKPFIYMPTIRDVDYCLDVAKYRDKVNRDLEWETGKHQNYSVLRHFVGACGELAVSRMFGILWDGAKLDMLDYQEWRKVKPDLGIFEVKTINYGGGVLALSENDKDWATALLMHAPCSWETGVAALTTRKRPSLQPIRLLGHISVKTGKEIGVQQVDKSRVAISPLKPKTRFIVERSKLRSPNELSAIMAWLDKARKEKETIHSNGTTFRLSKWVI